MLQLGMQLQLLAEYAGADNATAEQVKEDWVRHSLQIFQQQQLLRQRQRQRQRQRGSSSNAAAAAAAAAAGGADGLEGAASVLRLKGGRRGSSSSSSGSNVASEAGDQTSEDEGSSPTAAAAAAAAAVPAAAHLAPGSSGSNGSNAAGSSWQAVLQQYSSLVALWQQWLGSSSSRPSAADIRQLRRQEAPDSEHKGLSRFGQQEGQPGKPSGMPLPAAVQLCALLRLFELHIPTKLVLEGQQK
jgi:hypothetical protein